jgi:multiple sugar transport system substrate-binding protein
MIARRAVLAAPVALAAAATGRRAAAQAAETLNILSNIAHQTAAQGTAEHPEGNVQAQFERAGNVRIVWRNIPWPQMRATFLRAISASSSEYDIVMIVDEWASSETLARLPSLEPFAQRQPIAAFDDIAQSMRSQFVADGALRAVPIRSNPQLVHYNTAIFAAAGIQPPRTVQQLVAAARAASGRRADGAQVYGLGLKGDEDVIGIVRAFGGEILSAAFEPLPQREPVVAALTALKELYQAGAIPPNFASTDANAAVALMRDGLLAMTIFGDSYFLRFNDPRASRIAGQVASIPVPGNGPEGTVAATKCAFWGMALAPSGNPAKRELAWSFIRTLASPEAQLRMAINGNGPVRLAVAEAPQYLAEAPYGRASAQALRRAEPQIPVFDGSAEVRDIFNEEATQAIAGRKPIDGALAAAGTRIAAVVQAQRAR